ncbi:MAG: hypothetical protein ACFB6S_12780 [Geminicoccaceae bacterium]
MAPTPFVIAAQDPDAAQEQIKDSLVSAGFADLGGSRLQLADHGTRVWATCRLARLDAQNFGKTGRNRPGTPLHRTTTVDLAAVASGVSVVAMHQERQVHPFTESVSVDMDCTPTGEFRQWLEAQVPTS